MQCSRQKDKDGLNFFKTIVSNAETMMLKNIWKTLEPAIKQHESAENNAKNINIASTTLVEII